ncbi:hypothetical protein [Gudongella sp. SC589]|uniref:hypothetical protein n=1 Tax=Gudongella sp. SC589 TaxID=3385990 RepID=UPI0039046E36
MIKARDLLYEVASGGDLDYQIYVVDGSTDKALDVSGMKFYDGVVEKQESVNDKVIGSLEAIKDNLVNGRRSMYGVYEITKDLNTIIEALKK